MAHENSSKGNPKISPKQKLKLDRVIALPRTAEKQRNKKRRLLAKKAA